MVGIVFHKKKTKQQLNTHNLNFQHLLITKCLTTTLPKSTSNIF